MSQSPEEASYVLIETEEQLQDFVTENLAWVDKYISKDLRETHVKEGTGIIVELPSRMWMPTDGCSVETEYAEWKDKATLFTSKIDTGGYHL